MSCRGEAETFKSLRFIGADRRNNKFERYVNVPGGMLRQVTLDENNNPIVIADNLEFSCAGRYAVKTIEMLADKTPLSFKVIEENTKGIPEQRDGLVLGMCRELKGKDTGILEYRSKRLYLEKYAGAVEKEEYLDNANLTLQTTINKIIAGTDEIEESTVTNSLGVITRHSIGQKDQFTGLLKLDEQNRTISDTQILIGADTAGNPLWLNKRELRLSLGELDDQNWAQKIKFINPDGSQKEEQVEFTADWTPVRGTKFAAFVKTTFKYNGKEITYRAARNLFNGNIPVLNSQGLTQSKVKIFIRL